MANEQEQLQQATDNLERIKTDCKVRMDALQARLKAATYEGQKAELQQDIDQLKIVFDRAIEGAEINRTKAEAENLVQKSAQDAGSAKLRADREEEIKNNALREWVRAGGEPAQFESAWPSIRQSVLNERVINALVGQQKPDTTIKL